MHLLINNVQVMELTYLIVNIVTKEMSERDRNLHLCLRHFESDIELYLNDRNHKLCVTWFFH